VTKRLAVFVLAVFLALPIFGADPAPSFSANGSTVTLAGIRKGATVAILSISLEARGDHSAPLRREHVIEDTDQDGAINWSDGPAIVSRSLWCAVDLETGEFVVGAPAGFRVRQMPLVDLALIERDAQDGSKEKVHLDVNRTQVEVLVVRPGKGAWVSSIRDGGLTDGDGKVNKYARASFSALAILKNVHAQEELKQIRQGDTVIVVDPLEMQIFAGRVAQGVRL
jgi:hypothetical protein